MKDWILAGSGDEPFLGSKILYRTNKKMKKTILESYIKPMKDKIKFYIKSYILFFLTFKEPRYRSSVLVLSKAST
jgi:hypothetical protein